MEMKATHSLHNRDGSVVLLLHDNGAGQVHYKTPAGWAWRLAWCHSAAEASMDYDVRKINKFKGNK